MKREVFLRETYLRRAAMLPVCVSSLPLSQLSGSLDWASPSVAPHKHETHARVTNYRHVGIPLIKVVFF